MFAWSIEPSQFQHRWINVHREHRLSGFTAHNPRAPDRCRNSQPTLVNGSLFIAERSPCAESISPTRISRSAVDLFSEETSKTATTTKAKLTASSLVQPNPFPLCGEGFRYDYSEDLVGIAAFMSASQEVSCPSRRSATFVLLVARLFLSPISEARS